jgi:hypothetical protein
MVSTWPQMLSALIYTEISLKPELFDEAGDEPI